MRLTPLQALLHPFFEELYQPQMKTPENKCLPELFNFTKEEYDYDKDSVSKILEKKKQ
jgi:glycogen synthase kinase 3 beta